MYLNLRRFFIAGLILAFAVAVLAASPAEAARKKRHAVKPPQDRYAEILIEASSGYVVSEKNADKRLYPASLTKMMTLYMTFEALEQGTLGKSQRIFVSKRAAAQEPSSLGLQTGDAIRVEDAILAIATKSANDCAVVLAEAIGNSEPRFAAMMTARAHRLGMKNTNFVNASGLFNARQVSTARDMSILSQALIRDYPRYYRYFSTSAFTYKGQVYRNHNKLMSSYRGMDGLKTGYVYASGYNLAASAVQNGTRLIGVIFGGRTPKSRNDAMAQLLNRGFSNVNSIRVASQSKPRNRFVAEAPVPVMDTEVSVNNPVMASAQAQPPQFESMGLVVDQGDTDISDDAQPLPVSAIVAPAPARIIRGTPPMHKVYPKTAPTTASRGGKGGGWAIQVGAFSSHDAGIKALSFAKRTLRGTISGVDSIAPLMTPRGMIYRARLSGLARNDAAQACQVLKGNCLVLTVE